MTTHQLNLEQSHIYKDGELLNCSQSFQQSNDPGVNMLGQRPGKPVYHPRWREVVFKSLYNLQHGRICEDLGMCIIICRIYN